MTPWTRRLDPQTLADRTVILVEEGHLDGERAIMVHDLDRLQARIGMLHEAFGEGALHGLAVKANPLVKVLETAVAAGAGLECASLEEVELSLAAGCAPEAVIFDSPAKTRDEIDFSLRHGLHLNLDNLAELGRVAEWVEANGEPAGHVGIRINPQVGKGTIKMTSVAGRVSKFGEPLAERRAELLEAYATHPFLDGIHLHVGSQGIALEQLVRAAVVIMDFRDEAEQLRDRAITQIDIGGGLPVAYSDLDDPPDLFDYAARLRDEAPGLFRDDTRIVTEFGRAVQAGCGWAVSRVEYTKEAGGERMAVIHLGADAFLRPAYAPEDWRHDFMVVDSEGRSSQADEVPVTIVGPLCFSGDILARDRPMPEIGPDDLVVVRDTGAYTLGMWSRHCSRGLPKVVGWRDAERSILFEGESPEDVVRFWS